MKRRLFLEFIPTGVVGILLCPSVANSSILTDRKLNTERISCAVIQSQPSNLPIGKRVSFGWSAVGITPGESIKIMPNEKLPETNLWLRVSVAQEIWDRKMLHVRIPCTETYLGTLNILFSSVLVPYELEIDDKYASQINQHGLELTLESRSPLWLFSKASSGTDNSVFLPHILSSSKTKGNVYDFLNCFMSVQSVQAFGWREGTVLDGLWQIYMKKGDEKALKTIKQHLGLFFDDHQDLVYENAQSTPRDNQIDGIESTIPFATLARIYPEHPILQTVVKAWNEYTNPDGMIIDGKMISAEGCYTVAYPMAVIGKAWQRDDLKKKALEQLRCRFVLIDSGQFYLRSSEGNRTYQNWTRGAAWFLLGFARTISELKDEIQDQEIIEKFQEGVRIALSMQRDDGLWACFMHEPESLPDTSGSAGIAAAITTGIKDGYLPESYRMPVKKCWNSLQEYITPDGFLKGVAQDNRGGMSLQQSDYRVIAQMGMGMMAQLYAEMH